MSKHRIAVIPGDGIGNEVVPEAIDVLEAAGRRIVGAGRPEIEIPSARFGELLSETRPEAVVHCVGPASVGASVQDPLADLEGSVAVLAAVLDGARRLDPPPRSPSFAPDLLPGRRARSKGA